MSSPESETALLARQAIYNTKREVFGYELLYRGSADATAAVIGDVDLACRQTIVSALCDIGLESLVGTSNAFVNLSESVLFSDQVSVFPPFQVILELLEDVPSSERMRSTLTDLRKEGYRVALDDFELEGPSAGLVDLADIIKVDVLGKEDAEVAAIVKRLRETSGAELLAEKVETHREYEYYRELGFDYFQGFFLCRPQIVAKGRVPRYKRSMLELLAALEDPAISLAAMEKLVQRDAALSYKLLRLLNSSMMGLRCQVTSIAQAVVLIGQRKLKRWASLMAMAGFDDSPEELLTLALIRGRMCETLAERQGASNSDSAFTAGLFSALDAMSGQTMDKLVETMPLAPDIRAALTTREGAMGDLVQVVLEYERGNWDGCCQHGYSPVALSECYLTAVDWADSTRNML